MEPFSPAKDAKQTRRMSGSEGGAAGNKSPNHEFCWNFYDKKAFPPEILKKIIKICIENQVGTKIAI